MRDWRRGKDKEKDKFWKKTCWRMDKKIRRETDKKMSDNNKENNKDGERTGKDRLDNKPINRKGERGKENVCVLFTHQSP